MIDVVVLTPSSKAGGAERAFLSLVRRLPDHGIRPHVVALEDGALVEWLAEAGYETTIVKTSRTRYLHRAARTVLAIRSIVRERHAQAMISNMAKGHVYGGAAARIAHVPAVWWQHEAATPTRFERAARVMPAAAVICVSTRVAHAQQRLTPGAHVVKINPGLPIAEIEAQRSSGRGLRDELGWTDAEVVGIVGRLQPWKGQEIFLRAAVRILEARPRARFAIVGGAILGWEGDYPQQLERLAAELGIADRVLFAGHRPDPWRWTDAFDVAVHASHDEPFGLVLVEAMALGTPLVASAGPGPVEIVGDGESGLLVPPGDEHALAEAVVRVLEDPDVRERLVAGGRRRAWDFDESHMARSFAEVISSAVNGGMAQRSSRHG